MRSLKRILAVMAMAAVLLAFNLPVGAIGFVAEEVYESVFVIYSANSLGSGFAVGENCVVTNAHVIEKKNDVTIRSYSGENYEAYVVGMDEDLDIAVLAVEGASFTPIPFADLSTMNTGDDIYAIGAPKSMAYTLTKGVISAKERQIAGGTYIQIDAPINEGNSGGPLLNDDGQVLGVNTLKMQDSEGIGLAIPAQSVCAYLDELGLETDDAGNVVSEVDVPAGTRPGASADYDTDVEEEEEEEREKAESTVTTVACTVAAASIICNIVLAVLLVCKGKKEPEAKPDPRERTDFDIEILE